MSLDWLTDIPLPTIQLHGAFDLESTRRSVPNDPDENEPLAIARCAIVNDLGSGESSMSIKDLLGRASGVFDSPMEDSGFAYETERAVVDPFPEYNVLVDNMRFHFLLGFDIENLELALGCR